MKKISVILKEYQPNATESERLLMSYLINNLEEASLLNIKELAKKTFCSPATIVRLCKKLKLAGFKRLHRMMMAEIHGENEGEEKDARSISLEKDIEGLIDKVTLLNIDALRRTKELLNIETLEKCSECIITAQKIALFGEGSSLVACLDARDKFLKEAIAAYCPEGLKYQIALSETLNEDDVAILIADENEDGEIVKVGRKLKSRKVTIITITRLESSSLSRLSDYNINISSSDIHYDNIHSGSRISVLNVLDILFILCAQLKKAS